MYVRSGQSNKCPVVSRTPPRSLTMAKCGLGAPTRVVAVDIMLAGGGLGVMKPLVFGFCGVSMREEGKHSASVDREPDRAIALQ